MCTETQVQAKWDESMQGGASTEPFIVTALNSLGRQVFPI